MESSHPLSGNPAPGSCRWFSTLIAAALFAFAGLPVGEKDDGDRLQKMPHVNITTEPSGVVIPNLLRNLSFIKAVLASDPQTQLLQNYSYNKSFISSLGEYIFKPFEY